MAIHTNPAHVRNEQVRFPSPQFLPRRFSFCAANNHGVVAPVVDDSFQKISHVAAIVHEKDSRWACLAILSQTTVLGAWDHLGRNSHAVSGCSPLSSEGCSCLAAFR